MKTSPLILQHLPVSQRSLRIAVVTETYPPEINGVAMTLARIVTGLQAKNHQIQLIRPRQNADDNAAELPQFEEVLQRGVPIPRYNGLKMGLPAKSALLRLWQTKRPDIVHIATEGLLGWSALAAANKLKIPVATDFHTNFHAYTQHYGLGLLRRPVASYLRKFHNKARLTMVPTHSLRDELHRYGYRNLAVVSRGVDTALFNRARRSDERRRQWGAGTQELVALYVGRLAPEKNLALVMDSFTRIQSHQPNAKLVLVGDGPERAPLESRHPQHIFAGMRSGVDLAQHYASADLFLFPSTTETYGNVTLEAMASGLAVVAYDYAAARELIRHGANGLLAPFDQAPQFIALAENLAATPGEIGRLGNSARDTAETVEWAKVYDAFERELLSIVREGDSDVTTSQLSFIPD
ncbi:MAG TPA: glycoside hydrolase [Betaproteobacteria bacterium]|nr:glycoside hydrolase [Betaproteobacteria bacterium]